MNRELRKGPEDLTKRFDFKVVGLEQFSLLKIGGIVGIIVAGTQIQCPEAAGTERRRRRRRTLR